jgi:DNA-binding MarR family transcriptional regulator
MSKGDGLPFAMTHKVRDTCICLHVQRAARAVARRFDEAMRPVGLTNGQFSLLMSLNRPGAARMWEVADVLAMDRTTLTAALKPLVRRGLVTIKVDENDKRSRRLTLTPAGRGKLRAALPIWKREHALIDGQVGALGTNLDRMRADLRILG